MDHGWKLKIYNFFKEWEGVIQKIIDSKIEKGFCKAILIYRDKK